jgi:hypothetical protein
MPRARAGGGRATNDASRRRFCAIAARTNSFWAPRGPRRRSRPSLRIRFKCANRISDLLALTPATAQSRRWQRATWQRLGHARTSRGILRDGSFGQHCGMSEHTSQSSLLARYRSVLPPCTVPRSFRTAFRRGNGRRRWTLPYRMSPREKVPSSPLRPMNTGICGTTPFSSTSQFSIGADP